MTQALSPRQTQAVNSSQFTDPHCIEEAAYYKWLNRGRQGSSATEDWLEAELELQSNLYSEDDEVERSLTSIASFGLPKLGEKRLAPSISIHRVERRTLSTPPDKDLGASMSRGTSNQTTMASEQDET